MHPGPGHHPTEEPLMRRLLCLVPVVLLSACAAVSSGEEQPVRELASGSYSQQAEQRFEFVTTRADWAPLWDRTARGPIPEVDFSRESVVAVFMGQRPTGGHAIRVEQVVREGPRLTVEVLLQAPGPDCMTTQALTQPYHMVAVPAGATRAEFVTREIAIPCGE